MGRVFFCVDTILLLWYNIPEYLIGLIISPRQKSGCNGKGSEMEQIDTQTLVQTVSVFSLAAIALTVGVQKLIKDWKSTTAETSVITLMHTELERMSLQNSVLSQELNRLQKELIVLNQQLSKLTLDNQMLHNEVVAFTLEIEKFKELAHTQKGSAPNAATRKT